MAAKDEQLILECPHCQDCHSVSEWNEAIGLRDEPIPLDISEDKWDDYARQHEGRIDCPSCEEVVIYEDMTPV